MPVMMVVFVITANISVSFFLELECFAWFLLVYALFTTTPPTKNDLTSIG